jgi:hypothetical protein
MTKHPRLIALLLFLVGFAAYWLLVPGPTKVPAVPERGTMFFAGRGADTTRSFRTAAGRYELRVTSQGDWQAIVEDETGHPVVSTPVGRIGSRSLELPTGTHRLQIVTDGDWTATLGHPRPSRTAIPPATIQAAPSAR